MKRLIVASMAALMAASSFGVTAASADPWDHRDHRGDRHDWDRDRHDDRRGDHRWDRRHNEWNDRNHNGYSYNGRWYYGPPPAAYYGRVDYGWHDWRRGDRLPRYYWDRYREVDYRYYRLRPPPYGYHYVRDDRGAVLLVGIATGVILSTILNDRYDRY